jgi:hypothetical protein
VVWNGRFRGPNDAVFRQLEKHRTLLRVEFERIGKNRNGGYVGPTASLFERLYGRWVQPSLFRAQSFQRTSKRCRG